MTTHISRIAIATIAILVFAVWAILNLIQTQVARNDAMAARVFDMSREYRGQLGPAGVQFSTGWNNYLNDTIDSANGAQLDEQAYSDLVDRFLALDNNNASFAALSSFYEEVGECVDADLCDFWTARSLFGSDIVTFYHNMYPVLEREQQSGGNVNGLLHFVDRMRDADRGILHRRFEWHFLRANPD
ncbi:MAG: hypothetical protein ABSA49_12910 [Rhizomicrobium sp.]|jgi:hypothetical protein